MTHTTNFNLSQWAKSDRIQMADFNADNVKLDSALSACCQFYTMSYTGDGAATKTFTFPHKPLAIFLTGGNTVRLAIALQGCDRAQGFKSSDGAAPLIAWNGSTATLTMESHQIPYFNCANSPFTLLALLDASD